MGSGYASEPWMTSRSVWQSPLALTLTRTSVGASGAISSVSSVIGSLTLFSTAALNFMQSPTSKSKHRSTEDTEESIQVKRRHGLSMCELQDRLQHPSIPFSLLAFSVSSVPLW